MFPAFPGQMGCGFRLLRALCRSLSGRRCFRCGLSSLIAGGVNIFHHICGSLFAGWRQNYCSGEFFPHLLALCRSLIQSVLNDLCIKT